ncbi:hypothetical protein K7X08_012617 [Anisodus acutangulus]|uniref:Uncharacterized protein n=1 Tax=Anisodus acutangulus TaxID=402998 RepID=A0A9Q1MAE0_9SOLA|nr:hypothetical protein K7X08_012617 [Anisodus acutangulus]
MLEERAKEQALVQVEEESFLKEAAETTNKRNLEALHLRIEIDFQRHEDDLQRLEKDLSRLKSFAQTTDLFPEGVVARMLHDFDRLEDSDEERAKEQTLVQVEEESFLKEAAETTNKRNLEALHLRIEIDFQRHEDDLQRLEKDLSRLKLFAGLTDLFPEGVVARMVHDFDRLEDSDVRQHNTGGGEERAKEQALVQVEEESFLKEAAETTNKRNLEALRLRIEIDFQRHEDDLQRLEKDLSRLKSFAQTTDLFPEGDVARMLHDFDRLEDSDEERAKEQALVQVEEESFLKEAAETTNKRNLEALHLRIEIDFQRHEDDLQRLEKDLSRLKSFAQTTDLFPEGVVARMLHDFDRLEDSDAEERAKEQALVQVEEESFLKEAAETTNKRNLEALHLRIEIDFQRHEDDLQRLEKDLSRLKSFAQTTDLFPEGVVARMLHDFDRLEDSDEERAKEQTLVQVEEESFLKEAAETTNKRNLEALHLRIEIDFQRHEDDLQRLEKDLSRLKLFAQTTDLFPEGVVARMVHDFDRLEDSDEERAKEQALVQVEEESFLKEAAETTNKRNLEALRLRIEIDFQRHEDDLQRLEKDLSRLKSFAQTTDLFPEGVVARMLHDFDRLEDFDAKWRQEERAKEQALVQVEEESFLKEAAETTNKRNLEALRLRIEIDFQRHEDDLQRLEKDLSRLKSFAQTTDLFPEGVVARMLHDFDRLEDSDAKWRQEERAKEQALVQVDEEPFLKEATETTNKRNLEASHLRIEIDFQRHEDDLQRLEKDLSRLKSFAHTTDLFPEVDVARMLHDFDRLEDSDAKWRQEERAKEQALVQVEEESFLKEAAETTNKRNLEALRLRIEIDFQRHEDDLQRLEKDLSRLKSFAHTTDLFPEVDVARMLHDFDRLEDSDEERAKEQALVQVEEESFLKEAAETTNKRNLEALRLRIEIDFQRHEDDLQRLEKDLSRLKSFAQTTDLFPEGDVAKMLHDFDRLEDSDAKWRQEERAKEQALVQVEEESFLKEAAETTNKRNLEVLRLRIDIDFQRHEDDLQRLEKDLSRLKSFAQTTDLFPEGDVARMLHDFDRLEDSDVRQHNT